MHSFTDSQLFQDYSWSLPFGPVALRVFVFLNTVFKKCSSMIKDTSALLCSCIVWGLTVWNLENNQFNSVRNCFVLHMFPKTDFMICLNYQSFPHIPYVVRKIILYPTIMFAFCPPDSSSWSETCFFIIVFVLTFKHNFSQSVWYYYTFLNQPGYSVRKLFYAFSFNDIIYIESYGR